MPHFSHHLHLPFFNLFSERDLRLLYYNRVLRDLVTKLAFFFIPIYLYQLGGRIIPDRFGLSTFEQGFLLIASFIIVQRVGVAILVIPLNRIGSAIGYQRSLVLSYAFRVAQFAMLFVSTWFPPALFLSALFDSAQTALYWPNYHTLMTQYAHKKDIGASLGILQFILLLVAAVTPAIAGLLSSQMGFAFLFFLGIFGALGGLILSLLLSATCDLDQVSFAEFKAWMRERRFKVLTIATTGRQMYEMAHFLWPLYLFFLFSTVERVGLIATLSLVLALVVTASVTFRIDHSHSRSPYRIAGFVLAAGWLLRTQIFSVWGIALIDAVDRVVGNYHSLYYDMVWYKRGRGSQAHSYFVYYELILSVALVSIWVGLTAVIFLTGSWQIVFIMGALGALMSVLMNKKE